MRFVAMLLLSACSDYGIDVREPTADTDLDAPEDTDSVDTDLDTEDTSLDDTDDTDDTDSYACHEEPAAADRVRHVVISHPYDASAGQSDTYEVLELDTNGALSRPGTTFNMTRATIGGPVFTPDGEVGIAVGDEGALGIFLIDANGDVVVVEPEWGSGHFYASSVTMDPSGSKFWVVDSNWRNNGGGLYEVELACDGTPTLVGLLAEGKQPTSLLLDPADPTRGIVPARDFHTVTTGANLFEVDLGGPTVLSSTPVFPDDDAIVSHAVWSGDLVFVSDNSFFTDGGDRVGIADVTATGVVAAEIVEVEDPVWLASSPFDDRVLVVSGYGNGIFVLDNATGTFVASEVSYSGAEPELPGTAAVIDRGSLTGHVLVSEVSGVRQLTIASGGDVTDDGRYSLGSGYVNIVGSLGIQP
jgi:hypothetical protein